MYNIQSLAFNCFFYSASTGNNFPSIQLRKFKYYFIRGTNTGETACNIKTANERTVRFCFKLFQNFNFNLKNKQRGRPVTQINNAEGDGGSRF